MDANLGPQADALASDITRRRLRSRIFGLPTPARYVGRYKLLDNIGQGAMGMVCLARDEQLERDVALKFVGPRGSEADLLREAQALARVIHPNVVTVFDTGVHEGRVWLAMAYVRGRTLRQTLAEVASASDRSALVGHWLVIGRALAAVHAAGLIHRDVKPENVVLGDDGWVRLIDFSLALGAGSPGCADQGSCFAGTACYAAPEQRAGLTIDARADQYAYGACVWEALTSARPRWQADGKLVLPRAAMLSPRVVRVLRRAMAERPEDRYPTIDALVDALERVYLRR